VVIETDLELREGRKRNDWPPLPYEEWRETRDTLHMYAQVIGKLRLALSPFEPEWAHVPLYVSARGLTTPPIPVGLRTIDAEFDLIGRSGEPWPSSIRTSCARCSGCRWT
jgi:hypothetical protein